MEEYFLKKCIEIANESLKMNENPFGCIIVSGNTIIAQSGNSTNKNNDISSHAEINALRIAQKKLGKDLSNCELYSNCEPCVMCSFVIRELKIKKVVFGVLSPHMGGYSKWKVLQDKDLSFINPPFSDPPVIIPGILEKEVMVMFNEAGWNEMFKIFVPLSHDTKKGVETKLIHAHVNKFQEKRSLVSSINRSVAFTFDNVDQAAKIFEESNNIKNKGNKYVYARGNHPNQRQLELLITELEHGTDAVTFSSGMAAITAFAQTILAQGDHIVASNVIYGDSFHLFSQVVRKWGIKTTFVDITNLDEVKKSINKNTKMIYLETPSNPLLTIADIVALSKMTKEHNILLVVDNTLASPYLQQPLLLGADVVIESTTKYLSGHSDAIGGIVIAKDKNIIMELWGMLFVTGAVIDPQAAWLTLRGLKTLALRMEKHNANALAIAKYLSNHPKVKAVNYPGLLFHPQYDIARLQMNGFGGVLSFEVKGGIEKGKNFIDNLHIFSLSVSLGAVESLINHPASMTHRIIPRKNRLKSGITDGLIRLSIGIEDVDDLIADLEQAFKKI